MIPMIAAVTAQPGFAGEFWGIDLTLAAAVQKQMLPQGTRQLATVRYAGASAAAGGIGGDYYDFLNLGPASLGFVLADVSGKGIAAALLMANLQASIRSECSRGVRDLGAMLERVNAQFLASTLPQQYATLFFGRYDDRTRRLSYVNCAQQPVFLVRHNGCVERLETTSMPLGLVPNWTGEQRSVQLSRGDAVWLCSDGVIEAGIESGSELGEERLLSLIATSPECDMKLAVERILDIAGRYDPSGAGDDMTVVEIKSV